MSMKLYDKDIACVMQNIKAYGECRRLDNNAHWKMNDKEKLVLRSDMAYELGGGMNEAVSALAFTTDKAVVDTDGVYLIGDDMTSIDKDIPYARLTFIRLKENLLDDTKKGALYAVMRAVDYVRYNTYPDGFMMRISSVKEREPVRISKEAVNSNISFSNIGSELIRAYKTREEVEAVKIYFITSGSADYTMLKQYAGRCEQITDSLNHIFNGLVMDCSTCSSRELCDEIEDLRKFHMDKL